MLDVVQSIGFWIGLAWSVWHVRRAATAHMLLIWLVVMLSPAVLTGGAATRRPRPAGRSGRQTAAAGGWREDASACKAGTAALGVPRNTVLTDERLPNRHGAAS